MCIKMSKLNWTGNQASQTVGQYSRTCCGCAANCPFLQVCVFGVRWRARQTHKLVLQLVVAAGDPPVRGYCPSSLRNPEAETRRPSCFVSYIPGNWLKVTFNERRKKLHFFYSKPQHAWHTPFISLPGRPLYCPLSGI